MEYDFLSASGCAASDCVSFVVAEAAEFAMAPLFVAGDAHPLVMPTVAIGIMQIKCLTTMLLGPKYRTRIRQEGENSRNRSSSAASAIAKAMLRDRAHEIRPGMIGKQRV
jgi:hypothetical protein